MISAFLPYDGVGHAGGKTVNYYMRKFSGDTELCLMPFVTREEAEKSKNKKWPCEVIALNYGYSFFDKVIRKIMMLNTKYNPMQKYHGLYNDYDLMLLKKGLKELKNSNYEPDVIILEWTQSLIVYEIIKSFFPNSKYVASEHDFTVVGYKRKLERAEDSSSIKKAKRDYENMRRMELQGIRACDLVVFHSREDLKRVKEILPECKHLSSISPYYDNYAHIQWKPTTKNIIFFGAMNRIENVESAIWFYENVFVKLSNPELKFVLLGSSPDVKLLEMAKVDSRVVVTGFVDDIIPWIESCMCMVAPLVLGAGIKVKVLETLSAGVPLLTNSLGMEGIHARDKTDYFHCETPEDYVKVLEEQISNEKNMVCMSESARAFVKNNFDLEDSYKAYLEKICHLMKQ